MIDRKQFEGMTPGPWWRDDDGFIASGSDETYVTVADFDCSQDIDPDEREANKRAALALPDLLAALDRAEQENAILLRYVGKLRVAEAQRDALAEAIRFVLQYADNCRAGQLVSMDYRGAALGTLRLALATLDTEPKP